MIMMFALLSDPAVIVGVPAVTVIGWGVRELISIRERLTRIETEIKLRQPTYTP